MNDFPPLEMRETNTPPNLLELITPFAKSVLDAYETPRGYEVLKYRFGLEGSKTYTLQEIGYAYDGLSRERIRQIEARAIDCVREALFGQSQVRGYPISEQVITEANEIFRELKSSDSILIENEILQLFESRYHKKSAENETLHFLLSVFGFDELTRPSGYHYIPAFPAWVVNTNIQASNVWLVLNRILSSLKKKVIPLSLFELKIEVNRKSKTKLSDEYILYAIRDNLS